jgi:hypothetical protein
MRCLWCGQRTFSVKICSSCDIITTDLEKFLKESGEKGTLFVLEKYLKAVIPTIKIDGSDENQWWGVYNINMGTLLAVEFFAKRPDDCLAFAAFTGVNSMMLLSNEFEIKKITVTRSEI